MSDWVIAEEKLKALMTLLNACIKEEGLREWFLSNTLERIFRTCCELQTVLVNLGEPPDGTF